MSYLLAGVFLGVIVGYVIGYLNGTKEENERWLHTWSEEDADWEAVD